MVDYNYLTPIVSFALNQKIILFGGRAISRRNLFIQIFSELWPILEWNYIQDDIGFNSKKIKKIPDRKARRVFYQSFRLYKKTPPPRPDQKVIFFKNEWPQNFSISINEEPIEIEKMSDYSFITENFNKNFMCAWDLVKTE
ncbi:hypothetical protein [Acinetobacter baumannii]|uniref:hypothetical protein n=1 Tax=Acinetobacter baumannii TaxID=470 RepID=UPI000DE5DBC9|nr:hypothetical protein [Acinetobacter baumannii]EKT7958627.1 hypothetical protein [Acinetobacter baumannii]EKU0425606.1 hypothetical protein [Acinetobacter baumannii]EKV6477727.1 hypothetical protein [Acinetobacter baumannii]EKW3160256.1 hypothetical protein [Acinetobacter baumannii]EKX7379065.1 hypothetical protein [Acinetobacter baumannii]